MEKVKVCLLGFGGIARSHFKSYLKLAQRNAPVELVAICDIDPERLEACKKEFNVPIAVTDYKELVNLPEVDAVVIGSPDQDHPEMVAAFLRAGKDVMCEKPMALSPEECEEMMRIEKETGRMLMIGQVCRFTPGFVTAKQLIDDGRIGDLIFVESEYAHNYTKARGHNDWRVVPERHGFIGGGCHAVDLLRWIAGDPIEVYAHHNHKSLADWPTPDTAIAIYKFPNDVMGKVFVSTGCKRNYTMRTCLYGTTGTIIFESRGTEIFLYQEDHNGNYYTCPRKLATTPKGHNMMDEVKDFIDAIVQNKPNPISSIEGASTVAVCRAAVESAQTSAPVQIKYPEV